MRSPFCLALTAALLAAACSDSSTVSVSDAGKTDLAPDDVAPDVATVRDVPDATLDVAPDVPVDTPPADVRRGCASNADCATDPVGRVCDTASGRCVGCLPTMDTCPAGQYCVGASNLCAPGCRNDDGCASTTGGDAGARGRRCDTITHTCQECVTDEHCPSGSLCVGNICVAGCSSTRSCPSGQTCCSGACIDPQTNTAHCGRCDSRCTLPNAVATCTGGTCAVGMCTAPNADCDMNPANGCETDVTRTLAHCGRCGNACATRPHTSSECTAGSCAYTCEAGFADCDMNPANGCETDTRTDTGSCGRCGARCAPPNGTAVCAMGACAIGTCNAGFGDCDMNPTNGCEADLGTTVSHCGMCGNACPARPNALSGCLAGACVTACVTGYTDCDGASANGCEVDVRTSASNCGACGRVCALPQASSSCVMGACTLTACATGFGDCDMSAANGCETDLRSTLAHCGACGAACPSVPGASPTCASGRCGYACAPGRGDCDMIAANGCETDLTTSATSCGACGSVCASGVCAGGVCQAPSCTDRVRNGTETDVDCGGSCAPCALCQSCVAARDCAAGTCSSAGRCTYRTEVYIPWLDSCHGPGGPGNDVVVRSIPAGTYDLTALNSGGTVWNPVTWPSTGWTWYITCDNLSSARMRTPAGVLYPTPDAAYAALTSSTDQVPFAGGDLRCSFSDSYCGDNQGGVRFRMERTCP